MATASSLQPEQKEPIEIIKGLAEAVSVQVQVANRTWLALISVALFVIPRPVTKDGMYSLPLNFGDVRPLWFDFLVFSFLLVLTVAFASAHLQSVRAERLAHSVIDTFPSNLNLGKGAMTLREYFDMLRKPSFIRVSPLAQTRKGKAAVRVYMLSKLFVLLIYFGVPVAALVTAFLKISADGPFQYVYALVGLPIPAFALLLAIWQDVRHAFQIAKNL